jgi:arylformamidase
MNGVQLHYHSLYDISVLLGVESVIFPGTQPFTVNPKQLTIGDDDFRSSDLVMSAHAGTHLDAPAHLVRYQKTIDQYSAKDFILPALVVDIKDREAIRPSELKNLEIHQGDALLFRTDNSRSGRSTTPAPSDFYVYMSLEAARFCVEKKVSLTGFDYFVAEKPKDRSAVVHHTLFQKDILILEGANLKDVPPGRYTLFCFPLKLQGSEGSPVRAILVQ